MNFYYCLFPYDATFLVVYAPLYDGNYCSTNIGVDYDDESEPYRALLQDFSGQTILGQ